ncbi:MAG TPA: hypothetical protein VLV56_17275 [Burkholderiales bacterium]|nr:hypothetical protein [Burkholderiales bacterium]
MFLFIVGMSGFGAGRANPAVVFTLATPLAFFLLCFLSAVGKFGPSSLRLVMGAVIILTLPFFWYLVMNGPVGIASAGALLGFLLLWLAMCRQQLAGYAQQGAQADSPAPGGPTA